MGRSATGDEARRVPWFNPTGIQKKQSPVWFHVFWQLCRKCARKMRSHLRRCQRLLFFGTAAGLEQSRIDDHLSKPPLVDDPTAHLLPGKKLIQAQVSHHIKHGTGSKSCCTEEWEQWPTSSSRIGPRRSRWRESSVSAWTQCPNRHQTGCCNWVTGQETHWRLCCGHRNLLGNQKQTHLTTAVTIIQWVVAHSCREIVKYLHCFGGKTECETPLRTETYHNYLHFTSF